MNYSDTLTPGCYAERFLPAMDRLVSRKWGVFNHFLYFGEPGATDGPRKFFRRGVGYDTPAAMWNARVDEVDVDKLVADLQEMGAGYYFLTLMQGSRYMLAPNAVYDEITGCRPGEACAERDLPMEIADALAKAGIDFYLYFTGDGPWTDPEAGGRMGYAAPRGPENPVSDAFVRNWTSVLREYAVRYGSRVRGWWIDGMYDWDVNLYRPHQLELYHDAVLAGNPDALVALNNGVRPEYLKYAPRDTFTCGEFSDFTTVPPKRFVDDTQTHLLAPLGRQEPGSPNPGWGQPGAKRPKEYLLSFLRLAGAVGMPVTFDIRCFGDGRVANEFDREQFETLRWVGRQLAGN